MAGPPIGTRVEMLLTLDLAAIAAGATLVGDMNPLHHDAAAAAASRYGGIIASGAHTAALLCGVATRFAAVQDGPASVGMDFAVRFRAPIRPGRLLRLEWVIAALEPHRAGTVARLQGRIVDTTDDTEAMTATLSALYFS